MRASIGDGDDDEETGDECGEGQEDPEEEEEEEDEETQVDGDQDSEQPSRSNSREIAETRPHGLGPCDSGEEHNDGQLASIASMDPTQDSQVPLLRRHRSKKSLESLQSAPSKDVLPTPASYANVVTPSKEEELAQLMAEIALLEGCGQEEGHTRHDAMLLMMGSPPKQGNKSDMPSAGKGVYTECLLCTSYNCPQPNLTPMPLLPPSRCVD